MILQDLINLAKTSELAQIHIEDETVISFINLGIIELYKRFPLATEEHIITLEKGKTIYDLPSDFMYLVAAYEEVPKSSSFNSVEVPINEPSNPFSINTISYRQIQIPLTVDGGYVSIIYVSKPVGLTLADLESTLPIPDQLITPLLDYIAYRGNNTIEGTTQGETSAYYKRFEFSCEKAKELGVGIASDTLDLTNRIRDRGFV